MADELSKASGTKTRSDADASTRASQAAHRCTKLARCGADVSAHEPTISDTWDSVNEVMP